MANNWAVWADESGSTHIWPQGTKDNRIQRVIERIENRDMPMTIHTLQVFNNADSAFAYADYLHTDSGFEFILGEFDLTPAN